jgi:hypothetical protein
MLELQGRNTSVNPHARENGVQGNCSLSDIVHSTEFNWIESVAMK